MLPDGSINPGEMTSFNHYAFGAVADWLHRTVAGLAPAAPGYRRLRIAPRPGPGLTSAAATHETPYGTAAVSWTLSTGRRSPSRSPCRRTRRRRCAARRQRAGRGRLRPALLQRDDPGADAGREAGVFELLNPDDHRDDAAGPVGPPPPYDPECGAVLAGLPPFPPLTARRRSRACGRRRRVHRRGRPNEELARGRRVRRRGADRARPAGAPDVALIICRPIAAAAAVPALYYIARRRDDHRHRPGRARRDARPGRAARCRAWSRSSTGWRRRPRTPARSRTATPAWSGRPSTPPSWASTRTGSCSIGGSAGGGLAAALALMARDRGGPALAGPAADVPDARRPQRHARRCTRWPSCGCGTGRPTRSAGRRCSATPAVVPDVSPYAAPARADDLSGLPPAFIDVGSADTFRDEDVDYATPDLAGRRRRRAARLARRLPRLRRHRAAAALSKAAVAARANWLARLLTP